MIKTSICIECRQEKSLDDFFKKKGRKCQSRCKQCTKEYQRKYYNNNKEKYRLIKNKRHLEIKLEIYKYLLTNPCKCGESDPACLDFDHNFNKKFNLSTAYNKFGLETVKKEMLKCTVRCSNCHRKKTAKEQNWYKNVKNILNQDKILI